MNLHSKARTCPASRVLVAKRLEAGVWSKDQAAALGISQRTAYKWLARFRSEGEAGLLSVFTS
jgi:transposase